MGRPATPGATAPSAAGAPDGAPFTVCFHGIGTPVQEREPGEATYWVGIHRFLAMLDWLVGAPNIAISFDDGNRSDLDVALPSLVERGLVASFFPVVGRLGDPWSVSSHGLEELAASGMAVGSHGLHHLPWAGLRGPAARVEILHPRHVLEDLLGRPVDRVAAPLGRYDLHTLALLRSDGCTQVNVSDQRPARPGAWVQPRFSVRADDTVTSLRARLRESMDPRRRARNAVVSAVKRWT
jgi:peptidoglycan/xylan/chitin deacetylase (PgdA/CDA1 family)